MIMMTFLPPISRWTFLNVGAAAWFTMRPTSVDPVNDTTRTVVAGRQRRADLVAAAGDQVDDALRDAGLLEHLDEVQRRQRRLRRRLEDDGVAADQRRDDLPRRDRHREIPRRDDRARRRAAGAPTSRTCCAARTARSGRTCRRPSPAMKKVMSIASCTSPRVSFRTLPISRVMSRANCSLRSAMSCAARNSISARSRRRHQPPAARRRARPRRSPRSTSAAVDFWNTPIRSSVLAGLRFSNVWPERDGTHSPSM